MKFIKYEVLELTDTQKSGIASGEISPASICDAVEILTGENLSVMSLFDQFKDRIVDIPYVQKDMDKYFKETVKLTDSEISDIKLVSQKMGSIDPDYERKDRVIQFSNLTDETKHAKIYQIGNKWILIDLNKVCTKTVNKEILLFKKLDEYTGNVRTLHTQTLKEWNCRNVVDEYNMRENKPFATENYVDCDQNRCSLKYIQTQIIFDKIKKFFRAHAIIRKWELADNEIIKIKDR